MVASISSNSVSNRADSAFSRLDTKNQGYIEKADLAGALSAADGSGNQPTDVDAAFGALDGDSDGKVTRSEMTEAMTRLSDQLNAQFDASRMAGGMAMPDGAAPAGASGTSASGTSATGASASAASAEDNDAANAAGGTGAPAGAGGTQGAGGPRGGGGAGGAGGAESTDSTDSTSTDYVAAADTDGDGTVSDAEQAAYDKKLASGEIDKNGNPTGNADDTGGAAQATRAQDPAREMAQAMNLLKAYADSDASTASASAGSSGVSVEV